MRRLISCAAMPDEPIWGHFLRFAAVNGLAGVDDLKSLMPRWGYRRKANAALLRTAIVEQLAGGRESQTLFNYFLGHSPYPLILRIDDCRYVWRYMLNRWSFHHASLYEADLTARFCSICAMENIESKGFAWFRRTHQLPGVEWCLKHFRLLHAVPAPMQLLGEKQWARLRIDPVSTTEECIPPFVHRYTFALELLARLVERACDMNWVESSLRTIERDEERNPRMIPVEHELNPPQGWLSRSFVDAPNSRWWKKGVLGPGSVPGLALRVARLARTPEEVGLCLGVWRDLQEFQGYRQFFYQSDAGVRDGVNQNELQKTYRMRGWPNHRQPPNLDHCVGLVKEMSQYSKEHRGRTKAPR